MNKINDQTKKNVLTQLKSSGHNLHLRTVQKLLSNEDEGKHVRFDVIPCSYYLDDISKKPREIDIYASRKIETKIGSKYNKKHGILRLFIECKYLKKPLIFFQHKVTSEQSLSLFSSRLNCITNSGQYVLTTNDLSSTRYNEIMEENKVSIISEPYKEMFEAMDTCIKAKLSTKIEQVDYMFIVVNDNSTMLSLKTPKDYGSYEIDDLEEVDHRFMMINYMHNENIGSKPYLVEIMKESILKDRVHEIWTNEIGKTLKWR